MAAMELRSLFLTRCHCPLARRSWSLVAPLRCPLRDLRRNCEIELASLARFGLDPNASAVQFDGFLADGQANACTTVFVMSMQAAKDAEDLFLCVRARCQCRYRAP